jgi:16S rRNA (guanine(1405)-N(7))-methyltransferase
MGEPEQLDELVQRIAESAKYRTVCDDLIRTIGRRELAARRNVKEAVKTTKNKLHQVAGAFLDSDPLYDRWIEMLAAARDEQERFRQVCLQIMQHHASSRERLPILPAFYADTLAGLPPIHSVLDVACGLNPLALHWMPLAPGASYYACDIYSDLIAFLNTFFELAAIDGRATTCDLVTAPPTEQVDAALVLKILPPLEQLGKNNGIRLLRALNARHLLVSFPARSLGGRNKQMVENYETGFRAMIQGEGWEIERFEYPTELAFLVTKGQ